MHRSTRSYPKNYLCSVKQIAIINGPNLNLLGTREPELYGEQTFEEYFEVLKTRFPDCSLSYFQSNVEGELVNHIQACDSVDAIVLNAAAYSHTSIAIADAVAAISTPVIGVHISNIYKREKERHTDLLAAACKACLFGFGLEGYSLAIDFINSEINEE